LQRLIKILPKVVVWRTAFLRDWRSKFRSASFFMRIQTTTAFKQQLDNDTHSLDIFCAEFQSWKQGDEFDSYLFGKDSAYIAPKVGTESYRLRHVHLVPLLDFPQLQTWNRVAQRKGRKTSDRALVYVEDGADNFLLIYILPEPDAHRIAQMAKIEDKETMLGFAAVANAFIETGSIIV
jgi:mRNA interferase YafO